MTRKPRFYRGSRLSLLVQEDNTIFYDDEQKNEFARLVNPELANELRKSDPEKQKELVDDFYQTTKYAHEIIERAGNDVLVYLRNKFPQGR